MLLQRSFKIGLGGGDHISSYYNFSPFLLHIVRILDERYTNF